MFILSLNIGNGSVRGRRARSPRSRSQTNRKRRSRACSQAVARCHCQSRPRHRSNRRKRVDYALQLQVSAQPDRRTPRTVSVDRRYLQTGLQPLSASTQPRGRYVGLLRAVSPSRPQELVDRPQTSPFKGVAEGRTAAVRQPFTLFGSLAEYIDSDAIDETVNGCTSQV